MAAPINAAPTLDHLESRLRDLEAKLGVSLFDFEVTRAHAGDLIGVTDLRSILDKLIRLDIERRPHVPSSVRDSYATDKSSRFSLHEEFCDIDRLLNELGVGPVVGPTLTSGANAPLLFRQLEVLASCESIKRDMVLLAQIRDFISIGRNFSQCNEAKVVDCTIVSSDKYDTAIDQYSLERLDAISSRAVNFNKRTTIMSHRADLLLSSYSQVMGALDEKLVLAKEHIEGADSLGAKLTKN